MEFKLELKPVEVIKKPSPFEIGIEETKDVVNTGIDVANAIIVSLEDGKITLADALNFIKPIISIPAAITDIEFMPSELENLSEDEVEEVIEMVKEKSKVGSNKGKLIAEESIKLIYQLYQLIEAIKSKEDEE